MNQKYSIFLAVDYFNTEIIFTAKSSGELSQKILQAIEKGTLSSNGAVRMYRTSPQSYQTIRRLMTRLNVPFHEAARPKEGIYEDESNIAVG